MKSLKNLVFAGLLLSGTAMADLLIEPHLGYNIVGTGSRGDNSFTYKYNGPQYGLGLGYQTFGLMFGGKVNLSSYDYKATSVPGNVTSTLPVTRSEFGVFVGYKLPILLRAWAAYYFSNTQKYDDGSKLKGNTFEIGAGFTGLPFVSLNLEYRHVTFDEAVSTTGVSTTLDSNSQKSLNEVVLGVSVPFNL